MLLNALKITYPNYNENNIGTYPLSFTELFILNNHAMNLSDIGCSAEAVVIYEELIKKIYNFNDDYEKERMYSPVLINYSTCLGRLERRREALAIIEKGESFNSEQKCLFVLPGLYFNKGYNLFKLGDKEVSIPYFIMAYYGNSMFARYGKSIHLSAVEKFIIEEMNINLL